MKNAFAVVVTTAFLGLSAGCGSGPSDGPGSSAVGPRPTEASTGPRGGTTVVYATTSLQCGNTTYTVSTGTTNGSCETRGTGSGSYVTCGDTGGNKAAASCASACGRTEGAGSCEIKTQQ